jgi:hypothetical protein
MDDAEIKDGKVGGVHWRQYSKVVRHKDFAKRIEIACENHPRAPSGHGRQVWLKNTLAESFGEKVSGEAVRKWFAGESRPKPRMMSIVARALGVDEAWLALGITPTSTPTEKRNQNALIAGAVNLVAAQIQLAGGNIAFPDTPTDFDITAIIRGKVHSIAVRLFNSAIHLPVNFKEAVIVVPTDNRTVFHFFMVPLSAATESGVVRGDYYELKCDMVSGKLVMGDRAMPQIKDFEKWQEG